MGAKNIIGTRIRTLRLSNNMTQADLANALNQSQSSITMYETGRREPDFETLEALADIFNVPMIFFVDGGGVVSTGNTTSVQSDIPINDDVRLLVRGLNQLSPEQIAQAKNVFRAMFAITNPELFEGDDDK